MKQIINIAVLAATVLSVTACKDVLEAPTKSSLDESVIFSSPSLAEGVIPGIIQSFGETNSYRGRYLVYYGTNTDVEIHNSLKAIDDDKSRLGNYNTNFDNGQMNTDNNAYAKFYEGIERANMAIRGLRTYGDVETNAQMAQILGEVLRLDQGLGRCTSTF